MKKLITVVLAAMAVALPSSAQLLWKISGKDMPESYLLGTYHLADYAAVDSLTGVSAVMERVSGVIGEIDFMKATSVEGQQTMAAAALAPADSTLSVVLSQIQLDSLQMTLDKYAGGIKVGQLDAMRPAFAAMMIEVGRAAEFTDGFSSPVDMTIQTMALERDKTVTGLETIEDQCQALFGGDIVAQAESLVWGMNHDQEMRSTSRRIFDAYIHGDLNEILSIIEEDKSMDQAHTERLIHLRNADWLRVLAGMLPAASLLIVVGAGHLPGEKGLIKGLRKLGFEVTPND